MKSVTLKSSVFDSWKQFHNQFSEVMGFPDFYGQNMNAWIDCMKYIDDPEAGMSKITIKSSESLIVEISIKEPLSEESQEILQALIECTAFVNRSFIEEGSDTRILLNFV